MGHTALICAACFSAGVFCAVPEIPITPKCSFFSGNVLAKAGVVVLIPESASRGLPVRPDCFRNAVRRVVLARQVNGIAVCFGLWYCEIPFFWRFRKNSYFTAFPNFTS